MGGDMPRTGSTLPPRLARRPYLASLANSTTGSMRDLACPLFRFTRFVTPCRAMRLAASMAARFWGAHYKATRCFALHEPYSGIPRSIPAPSTRLPRDIYSWRLPAVIRSGRCGRAADARLLPHYTQPPTKRRLRTITAIGSAFVTPAAQQRLPNTLVYRHSRVSTASTCRCTHLWPPVCRCPFTTYLATCPYLTSASPRNVSAGRQEGRTVARAGAGDALHTSCFFAPPGAALSRLAAVSYLRLLPAQCPFTFFLLALYVLGRTLWRAARRYHNGLSTAYTWTWRVFLRQPACLASRDTHSADFTYEQQQTRIITPLPSAEVPFRTLPYGRG